MVSVAAVLCILGFATRSIPVFHERWITAAWALVPPAAFWFEYFWFAPDLAKIAENLRNQGKDETKFGQAMDFVKYKLGQLNDFRGVSIPIWAAVLIVLNALYSDNVKTEKKERAAATHQTH